MTKPEDFVQPRRGVQQAASSRYCPWCGDSLSAAWVYCPGCGRKTASAPSETAQVEPARPVAASSASTRFSEATSLANEHRNAEVEALLRSCASEGNDATPRLALVRLLINRYAFPEAGEVLDEAVALDPGNIRVRLARAAYYARLGLYPQALADLNIARSLETTDVRALLYTQELYRIVNERCRSGFTRRPGLPKVLSWRRKFDAIFSQRHHSDTQLIQEV